MAKHRGKSEQKQLLKQAIADRKLAEKQKQKIAKAQIKELRPFIKSLKNIDLRKGISSQKRSYIDKAWAEYQELTSRPFKIYRSKSKKKLKTAQQYSRHNDKKPKFDVAFIPTASDNVKFIIQDDGLIIKHKHVTEYILLFDVKKLASNPASEIKKALAKRPQAKQFAIMAGKYQYNGGLARGLVDKEVLKLMARYSNEDANNYFGNWLLGIVAAEYSEQRHIDDFRREFEKARKAKLADKKNTRRRRGYKYGKKF